MLTKRSKSLYQIQSEFFALEDLIDDYDGDITGLEEWFEENFAKNQEDLADKIEGYIHVMRNVEALAEQRKSEAARIKSLAESGDRTVDRMKAKMLDTLVSMGISKIETLTHRISTPKVGGNQALKIAGYLPSDYDFMKAYGIYTPPPEHGTWSIDKDKLRADLKNGIKVEGAFLAERGRRLKIQ